MILGDKMQKSLTSKFLILIALSIFFFGSYIHYYIEKTRLEIEYDIKEVSTKISIDTIDIIETILRVFTVVPVAIIAVKYLKGIKTELKWTIMIPFLIVLNIIANITFCNFEINPIIYYQQSRYFQSLLYISLEVLLLVVPLLMLFERYLIIKIIGGFILLFLCWVMFQ
jgi:hypothetical protein